MTSEDLPQGWTWARLGDICEINPRTFDHEPSSETDVSFVPMAAVEENTGRLNASQIRNYGEARKKSYTRFQEGDILFAKITPCMENGKFALAIGLRSRFGVGSTEFHVIRPRTGVSAAFVLHYLLQGSLRREAERNMTGAVGQRRVPKSFLENTRIPVPPLEEQQRIVEALEDHLSRLGKASSMVRDVPARIAALRQAVVQENLGMSLEVDAADPGDSLWRLPEGWRWSTIGDLFKVYVGATPSRKDPSNWSGPVPWISSGEVAFNRIGTTRERISEAALGNRATRLHPPGTVMIAMIGEGKTRGQVAILDIEAAHNQNCASIRVSETEMLPEYVYLVLEDRYKASRRESSGGNQPALNRSKVEAIPIPVPPVDRQRAIVGRLEELGVMLKHVRGQLHTASERAKRLRKALLRQAFSGSLVSQDPSDEPASVLLERIQVSRKVRPTDRRGARSRQSRVSTERPAPPVSTGPEGTFVQTELDL